MCMIDFDMFGFSRVEFILQSTFYLKLETVASNSKIDFHLFNSLLHKCIQT